MEKEINKLKRLRQEYIEQAKLGVKNKRLTAEVLAARSIVDKLVWLR